MKKKVIVYVYNIDWDYDGDVKDSNLPSNVNLELNQDFNFDDIAEKLSEEYGYCVNGYKYKINE